MGADMGFGGRWGEVGVRGGAANIVGYKVLPYCSLLFGDHTKYPNKVVIGIKE